MKILNIFLVVLLLFTSNLPTYSTGVLCNSNKSICTVGKYTLRGVNLKVENGIMCTSNGSICTNGETVLRTGGAANIRKSRIKNIGNKNSSDADIAQISDAERLEQITNLYEKGLITQFELNILKKNVKTLDINESYELNKLAGLYENGLITQFEFNKNKARILGN